MTSRLFQRSGYRARGGFDQLRKVLCRLKTCGAQTRSAVGAGVHLANTRFLRQFAGIESFRRSSMSDQERFWSDLDDLELGLRTQEAGMAVGVGLYRIWLADTLAERPNIAGPLGEELTELSRKG